MMATKLIVFAAYVSFTAGQLTVYHVVPLPHLQYASAAATNDTKTDAAAALVHADPVVYAVYQTHLAFLEKLDVKPPYHYSYGYEIYNWKTGLTTSHHESRYTDVGVGTYILLAPSGSRTTVDYTVDDAKGFHAVVRRDLEGRPASYGYASMAGRLAYETHRALEGYDRRTDHPLAKYAYDIHTRILQYFELEPPYRYSWGYQVKDADTGRTRSQFESAYGATSEGSIAIIARDGSINNLVYNVDESGVSASPV